MARRLIAAALFVLWGTTLDASGHGPVFGGATPTLGKGGWQFDQAWMGRSTEEAVEQTLRSMISFGITERIQVSTSVPIPITTSGQPPAGRMTASMSDAPNVEATGAWRFHVRPAGHGARLESTVFAGASVPHGGATRRDPTRGPRQRSRSRAATRPAFTTSGRARDTKSASLETGISGEMSATTAWSTATGRASCNSIIRSRISGSSSRRRRVQRADAVRRLQNANSGGTILLVGPTTLLLYKQYGVEGGILFPSTSVRTEFRNANTIARRERQLLLLASITGGTCDHLWQPARPAPPRASDGDGGAPPLQLNVLGMD